MSFQQGGCPRLVRHIRQRFRGDWKVAVVQLGTGLVPLVQASPWRCVPPSFSLLWLDYSAKLAQKKLDMPDTLRQRSSQLVV